MQPDHYKTLELPPSATPDEIKKRYRSLARRYHPDVNPNPDAAQKIKGINEAYHVLGDADRRSVYDAERMLNSVMNAPKSAPSRPAASTPRPSSPPRSSSSARPASASASDRNMEFNGFGRTPSGGTPPAASPTKKTPNPDALRAADRMMMEAQLAFINRQYREAEVLCRQALNIDKRNATAHEILGDVFLKRGQTDSAVTAYTFAAQYNPRNITVQAKLERLTTGNRHAAPRPGPTLTHPVGASPLDKLADSENRDAVFGAVSSVFTLLFFGLCALLWLHPGHPFQDAIGWVSSYSFNLVASLAMGGTLAGILIALNGKMRPISEELLARGTIHGDERTPINQGAVLTGFALVFFYASFLVYLGIALTRNRLSLSVLRVYGGAFAITLLFALLYQPEEAPGSGWQTLLFGGNLVFPAMLFGWAVGDAVRLRGR